MGAAQVRLKGGRTGFRLTALAEAPVLEKP